jgi:hypothetical protein
MSDISNPIDLARQAAADFQALYEGNLISVIVYGSAAGVEFDRKRSDVNLLIILSSLTLPLLEQSAGCQEKWMKKRFSRPLFMDKEYVFRSLDSFPVEFLAMKNSYVVVYGEDVLAGIEIPKKDLRLQIEREIKGKWLHLMREWLEARKNPARLERLIGISLKDFSPIFKSLLHLKGLPIPRDKKSLFADVAKTCSIDESSLENVQRAAMKGKKEEMAATFPAYADAIKSIATYIDTL